MLIYEPKGKAREYSPLALNIYSGGCDHGCKYCYCENMQKAFGKSWDASCVTPRSLSGLSGESVKASKQILLSFVGDPYCRAESKHRNTRKALQVLSQARCSVAVLTKGGQRCLEDLEIFKAWPDHRFKIGATLTFSTANKSLEWEPGASLPDERIETLKTLHDAGITTWASIEPVIDPVESLAIIQKSLPYIDAYKVGKLNHRTTTTDWSSFCISAVEMIRKAKKKLYVKEDLRPFAPAGFLTEQESNKDSLSLPERSAERMLI